MDHSCGLFFLYSGEYVVDVTCSINKSPARRDRTRAVINDIEVPDENVEMFVDGIVKPLQKTESIQNSAGTILHKPLFNKWERRFVINVE